MLFEEKNIFLGGVSCVSWRSGHFGVMEVSEVRWAVGCCAMFLFLSPLLGQTATANLGAINTNSPAVSILTNVSAPVLDDRHKLRSGDKISFRVAEDGEEAKALVVTDSGEIELPYGFGRFTATDKTCRELAKEIKVALEKDYYKRATIHLGLDAYNNVRGKAYVSGEVSKPGPVNIPVDTPLKLSQAILLAGPPTQWAKLSEVKVVRQVGKNTRTMIRNVEAILKKGMPENDLELEPDDLVIVQERGLNF